MFVAFLESEVKSTPAYQHKVLKTIRVPEGGCWLLDQEALRNDRAVDTGES